MISLKLTPVAGNKFELKGPRMPQIISLMVKNWWTSGTGAALVIMTLIEVGIRTYNGEKLYLSPTEMTSILAGLGLMKAKDQNVTGGDKSNGLVPNPVQEVKAQAAVAQATGKPTPSPEAAALELAKAKRIADLEAELVKAKEEGQP